MTSSSDSGAGDASEGGRAFASPTEKTLARCEDEPIHIPGAVQPHGCLLEFDASGQIVRVSSNVRAALGIGASAALQKTLSDFFGVDAKTWVDEALAKSAPATHTARRITLSNGKSGSLVVHAWADKRIAEWLGDEEHRFATPEKMDRELAAALAAGKNSPDVPTLLDHVAGAVKAATGYDRVMVYRFHPDWHGEIVAERTEPGVVAYRGLHYPASDIPAQARRLYVETKARSICDVYGADAVLMAAPNTPAAEGELDLSHAIARSVSPVHIQYLRNMGSGATFVTSLLVNGKLWGLIACHHRTRYPVPWYAFERLRRFTDEASAVITARLAGLAIEEERDLANGRKILSELIDAATPKALLHLTKLLEAESYAVVVNGEIVASEGSPERLRGLVSDVTAQPEDIGFTDAVAHSFPTSSGGAACAGLAWAIVSRTPAIAVMVLRPEFEQTVTWGGDPEKAVVRDPVTQRLNPRGSFDLWKQTVRDKSRPWSESARATLELFRSKISASKLEEFVGRAGA